MREEERRVEGTGMRRVVIGGRGLGFNYVHCRKANMQAWRNKLDDSADLECRKCRRTVASVCTYGEGVGGSS